MNNKTTIEEKQAQLHGIIDNIKDEGVLDYLITFINLALKLWT